MLPMLERECVETHQWATNEELLDYFAIGQCTPGVIAVNTATIIGGKLRGFLGSAAATLGVVTPSLVIAAVLSSFADIPAVQYAFCGIRVAVAALIVNTVIKLIKQNVKNAAGIVICSLAFVIVAIFGASPIFVVIGAGIYGLVTGLAFKKRTAEK